MRGVCHHPRFVAADRCGAGAGANNAIFRRLWQQATSPSASHAAALAAGGAGAACSPRRGDGFVDLNVRGVWLRHAHQDAADGAGPAQPSTATTASLAPAAPTTLRSASDVHAEPMITTTTMTAAASERYTSHQQQLRPYQSACIEACLQAAREGVTRQAVSLPVGSGKTVVFANLIQALPPLRPSATRVLVLAHRTELVQQAAATIARTCPTLRVAVEQGTQVREALTALSIAWIRTRIAARTCSHAQCITPHDSVSMLARAALACTHAQ